MTVLQAEAKKRYGSLRKLAINLGLTPGCLHQINARFRRAWPRLRQQVAAALEMRDDELFDEKGWPREKEN
ncbi:helix-turn-helix domain-containing protein [Neomoorella thermoacetica]|uniref:helix-turn-helix domain-containing protein n=1 Tax=Neomoorella thermoacetica TaxID=1525 RepID=UPI00046F78E3|nr:helix-turn-helix domain-containing protein [Moorella thermoacetica]OIQ12806.1 hypothetical protein MOOTH_01900 [Moorella thermoacetica]